MSGRLQIVRRGFAGATVGYDLVGDLLPLMKIMQAGPFDRADVHEYIRAPSVRLNEPEALRCVEPFHCARRHGPLLLNSSTNLAEPLFIARASHGRSAVCDV